VLTASRPGLARPCSLSRGRQSFGRKKRASKTLRPGYIRECLVTTSQAARITAAGQPLAWRPHDFRRLFVTDAVRSGLPPHIAAKVCGHSTVDTTMGYAAIYPEDVIAHHRAFIARRRAERPSEEYRDLTAAEFCLQSPCCSSSCCTGKIGVLWTSGCCSGLVAGSRRRAWAGKGLPVGGIWRRGRRQPGSGIGSRSWCRRTVVSIRG
jgi:hypothetical protein